MITRNSETNMTIQSSDLRQKSTQAIPKEIDAEAMASARMETAYPAVERPRFGRAWAVPEVSCPYASTHLSPAQTVLSCAQYTGTLSRKRLRTKTTTATHTTL